MDYDLGWTLEYSYKQKWAMKLFSKAKAEVAKTPCIEKYIGMVKREGQA